MKKPTRRVRRHLRKPGKDKGFRRSGKGQHRFAFLSAMTDEELGYVFFAQFAHGVAGCSLRQDVARKKAMWSKAL